MVGNFAGDVRAVLGRLVRGRYIITSAFEQKRTGVFVESAQPCGSDPPLVCVACRKGHPISTIIRDSHHFGLCEVDPSDRIISRKFAFEGGERGDPFDLVECGRLTSGSPILKRGLLGLDCEVFRHYDLECGCELYIGQVLAARVARPDA